MPTPEDYTGADYDYQGATALELQPNNEAVSNQTASAAQSQYSELDIEAIAMICHEANRAYCEVTGDHSQRPWKLAKDWQQDSAVRGVRFALANPDAPDSAQHDAWMADKLADGWTYGPKRDDEAKTHPCLVPFDELPPLQQAKDRLFRAVVKALTPNLG